MWKVLAIARRAINAEVMINMKRGVARMRTVDTLVELEEIHILLQYLYMNEDHKVTVDNGVTQLEIRMTDGCYFRAKNLRFPGVPDLSYTDMMTITNMLGIIDQLKNVPPAEFKNEFKSRWEEIKAITSVIVTYNKINQRERI